jgi:hypothetical protein
MARFNVNATERRNGAILNAADSVGWALGLVAIVAAGHGVLDAYHHDWHVDADQLYNSTVGYVEDNATWKNSFFALLFGAFAEGATHYKKHSGGGDHH